MDHGSLRGSFVIIAGGAIRVVTNNPAKNFGDITDQYAEFESARVVVVPVPYDGTSTWGKGADKGPQAILGASANMELYDIETDSEPYRQGIFTDRPVSLRDGSVEQMVDAVKSTVEAHLAKDKFVVALGGEHSVSIGAINAYAGHFDNLTVLQLDAHADLRPEYDGSPFNHASVMAQVGKIAPIVQVGIRSMDITERRRANMERMFLAESICGTSGWIDSVVERLSENVYITIDLDVFDPSIMPSTGTPEPGGLRWYEVLSLLRAVCSDRNLVGFDVVELCPNPADRAPDFTAAKLVYKLLSYKFK